MRRLLCYRSEDVTIAILIDFLDVKNLNSLLGNEYNKTRGRYFLILQIGLLYFIKSGTNLLKIPLPSGFQVSFDPFRCFHVSRVLPLRKATHHICIEHIGCICFSDCINAGENMF